MNDTAANLDAFITNEPADGTVLTVFRHEAWLVLIRDDESAARENRPAGEHWYEGGGFEARPWTDWLENTDAVYALGEKLAER